MLYNFAVFHFVLLYKSCFIIIISKWLTHFRNWNRGKSCTLHQSVEIKEQNAYCNGSNKWATRCNNVASINYFFVMMWQQPVRHTVPQLQVHTVQEKIVQEERAVFVCTLHVAPMRAQRSQTDRQSHDTHTYDTYTKTPFLTKEENNRSYLIR